MQYLYALIDHTWNALQSALLQVALDMNISMVSYDPEELVDKMTETIEVFSPNLEALFDIDIIDHDNRSFTRQIDKHLRILFQYHNLLADLLEEVTCKTDYIMYITAILHKLKHLHILLSLRTKEARETVVPEIQIIEIELPV